MMRVFKIVFLGSIGLILIVAIVLAVFLATFDISDYKPRITQELSAALSRDVQIEQLRLDFKVDRGLTIAVKGLAIDDDPAFSRNKLLAVDLIYLNTDILALLFHRQIVISRVEISGPRIYLVRNKEGLLNAQALFVKNAGGRAVENALPMGPPARTTTGNVNREKSSSFVMPQMLIQAVRIENGALTFVDGSSESSLTVPLRQIDVQAKQISLDKPFPFQIRALLWADQQNIAASGEIFLDPKNSQINFQCGQLETDLSQWRLRTLPFYGVLKEHLLLEGDLAGKILLRDVVMRIGSKGLEAFSLNGELNGGRASSELLKQPLEDIRARFHSDETNIAITELVASLASGTISAQGRWSDYGRSNMLMFDIKADGVQLGELIPRADMPVLSDSGKHLGVEGEIGATFDAEGHGTQISELREAFQGDGSIEIRNGKLLNFNLLRFMLDKLSFIPDLAQKVEGNLPPRYEKGLRSDETLFGRVTSTVKLKEQALVFKAEVMADGFAITADGNLNFDQELILSADFFIPKDLAASMSESVPELSYLQDGDGGIHIPFKPYQGKVRNVQLYPDIEGLAAKVMQNRGKDELKKAIFRALDIDESTDPQQQKQKQAPADGQGTPPQDSRPEETLIEGIFDAIFKGSETP